MSPPSSKTCHCDLIIQIYFQVYLAIGGWGSSPSQGLRSTESLLENGPSWTITSQSLPFSQWYFPSVTWQNIPFIFGELIGLICVIGSREKFSTEVKNKLL